MKLASSSEKSFPVYCGVRSDEMFSRMSATRTLNLELGVLIVIENVCGDL